MRFSDLIFKCKKNVVPVVYIFTGCEGDLLSGLCLTEEESNEFDQRLIVPYIAIGIRTVIHDFLSVCIIRLLNLNEKNG